VRQSTHPIRPAVVERYVLARTLREHPEWRLEDLFAFIDDGRGLAAVLGELTVADLCVEPDSTALLVDAVTPARSRAHRDATRLRRALRAEGAAFDELVFEVLCDAGEVGAAYLRARLGGPRWKLQNSLGRLIAAGQAVKRGNTFATRYRAVVEHSARARA
jgi:hypothetical protein